MANGMVLSLLVGVGGFAGSIARYGLATLSLRFPVDWPLATLTVNVLGCLIIGIVTTLSTHGTAVSPHVRLAVATGFCGGFTTMSSMVYETGLMLRAREYLQAFGYVAGTFVLSAAAFAVGVLVVRVLLKSSPAW